VVFDVRSLAASACLVLAGSTWAQTVKSPDPVPAGGLERAQRAAANPMRMILEASRIKRRPDAEGVATVDASGSPRSGRVAAAKGEHAVDAIIQFPPELNVSPLLAQGADAPRAVWVLAGPTLLEPLQPLPVLPELLPLPGDASAPARPAMPRPDGGRHVAQVEGAER
jgi:hypothetical protein